MSDRHVDVAAFISERPFSRYQWGILALCFLIVFIDGFDAGAVGFVAPALVRDWGIDRAALGPLFSSVLAGLAVGAIAVGPLADRWGRRRVLILAVIVFGLGSIASVFAPGLEALIALRVLTGLGLGAAMPNAVTLMTEYCPASRRSLLVTLMFCGVTLGSSLGGFIAAALVPGFGWHSVFIVGGVAPLLLALALMVWLPESVRFLVVSGQSRERVAAILERIAPGQVPEGADFRVPEQVLGARGNPVSMIVAPRWLAGTLLLWLAYFMGLLVIFLVINWMPTLLREAGLDHETSSVVTALFQLGGTAGALLVGWAMDRVGTHVVLTVSYALGAAFVFMMGQSLGNTTALSSAVLAAGFCISGSQTPINSLAAAFYPTQMRATGVSWMSGIGRCGGVLGAFIAGPLLAAGWSHEAILSWLALPAAIAALAVAAKGAIYRKRDMED